MIVVYVKHYLNQAGRDYFNKEWFPYVQNLILKQDGFLAIDASPDQNEQDCINIVVKFSSLEKLNMWAQSEPHQKVINDLDPYRTSPQRWFVSDNDDPAPPLEKWESAPLPK